MFPSCLKICIMCIKKTHIQDKFRLSFQCGHHASKILVKWSTKWDPMEWISHTLHISLLYLATYLQNYKGCWVNAETLCKNKTYYSILSFKSLHFNFNWICEQWPYSTYNGIPSSCNIGVQSTSRCNNVLNMIYL